MVKVLVDNCILSESNVLQGVTFTQYKDKTKKEVEAYEVGFIRKPPLPNSQLQRQQQIDWLPTIASLSISGTVELVTYDELYFESLFKKPEDNIGDIFSECKFDFVEAAIERSYFHQQDLRIQIKPDQKVKFYKEILEWNPDSFNNKEMDDYLSPLTKQSIKEIQRFKDIAFGLTDAQLQDAFHLWTAEVNDIPYFLTIDRKFINAICQTKARSKTKPFKIKTKPVTPEQFCADIGATNQVPHKYSTSEFVHFYGSATDLAKLKRQYNERNEKKHHKFRYWLRRLLSL